MKDIYGAGVAVKGAQKSGIFPWHNSVGPIITLAIGFFFTHSFIFSLRLKFPVDAGTTIFQ